MKYVQKKYIPKQYISILKIFVPIIIVVFLSCGYNAYMEDACATGYWEGPQRLVAGMRVPDFTLREAGQDRDSDINLSRGSRSERAKPTIIMFWYLSCPDCVSDIKHIKRLSEKYGDKFTIITINVDSEEKRDTVLNFIKNQEMERFRNFFEKVMEIGMERFFVTADKYGVLTTPSLFLVTKDGFLKYKAEGEIDFDDFEYQMGKLIAEQAVLNHNN